MIDTPRFKRLFGPDRKCFDVAIDHGVFNEPAFLNGIEDMAIAVATVVAAAPDAVQLTIGQARHLQRISGREKPSLVLRTDVANVYGKELPDLLYSKMIEEPVKQALRLDAACVVVNLFQIPEEPEVTEQCLESILMLKPECEAYGMPLMIEPLVFQQNSREGGYRVDGNCEAIVSLVRQAVELGADIIKADPTDAASDYHKVIQAAGGIPVLVRGGGKTSDAVILQRTADLMEQGASGIVYGRNIVQHHDPAGMTRALMAVVHEGASPAEAAKMISPLSP